MYFFWSSFFVVYLWQVCCTGAAALSTIHIGIWSAVMAHVFSGPQKASHPTSNFCINVKLIVLSWVPLFQVGLPVGVVRAKPCISSLFSRWIAYTLIVTCYPPYAI